MALPALLATLAPVVKDLVVELVEMIGESSDPEAEARKLLSHYRALSALEDEARRRER